MKTVQVLALVAAVAMLSGSAMAVTLFEKTPSYTHGVGALYSDTRPGTGQLYGSSFSLSTDAMVTGLTWMGVHTGNMSNVGSFNLEIWSNGTDAGGYNRPDTKLADSAVALADANMTHSGQSIFGLPVYSFSADLGAPLALSAGETYWVSIYGNSSAGMFAWLIAQSDGYGGATYSTQGGQGPAWWSLSTATTFSVLGSETAAIPEPATACALALAVAGLGRYFRRRTA